MPTFYRQYRSQFKDVYNEQMTVDITDKFTVDTVPFELIFLTATGDPLNVQTVNNSQDPFNPILAKSIRFSFISTASLNSETFSSGTDNRFYVEAYSTTTVIFRGWLLQDDISERFVNPAYGNEVTLTATDNIGTLKDLELINNTTGLPLTDSHYWALTYILLCLERTGLKLNVNVVWNVFEEDFASNLTPLKQWFINSLTFEKEIGTKEDCYTILQKILSALKSRLFQHNGEWWIVRIHEYRGTAELLTRAVYDWQGVGSVGFTTVSTAQSIARANAPAGLHLINADAIKTAQRAIKYAKDSYPYEFPREIVPNIDFTRGDINLILNPYSALVQYPTKADFPVTGFFNFFYQALDTLIIYIWADDQYVPGSASVYDPEGWTLQKFGGGTPSSTAYIKRIFKNDSEESRFLVITPGTGEHWVISGAVPMHAGDKFNFSADQKLSTNILGGGYSTNFVAQLRLIGDNGTYWTLNANANVGKVEWVQSNSSFTTNLRYVANVYIPDDIDEMQEWITVSVEATPLPVTGSVYVLLRKSDFAGTYQTYFANVQFEYIPQINGTYQKYNGQYNKVAQLPAYKAKQDNEVLISDSPKKIFKGASKKFNGTAYVLTENWTDSFDAGASGTGRLGRIMAYDVWNQFRKERTLIDGTVKGVGVALAHCPLLFRFAFTDYSATKRFICLHYDLSVKRAEARGQWMEVHDTADTNDYATPTEFNYEQ